jgi:hypothetical protein
MKNKSQNTKSNPSVGKTLAISAGVAALAAAGYFFFGPNGNKNRKNMKGWMIKMKGEVIEKLEKAKEVTEPVYNTIVDTIATKYAKTVDQNEIQDMVKNLKKHWKSISGEASSKKKSAKKVTAKVK